MKKPRNRKKRPMFGPLVAPFPHRRDMGMVAGAAPEMFHDLEHDDAARKPSRDGGQDQGGGDVGMAGQFRYKSVARGLGAYRAEYKSTARKRSKRRFWPERKLGVK